jgi:hypothetical protein
MWQEGVWDPRAAVDRGRASGSRKLRGMNKAKALAARYQQDQKDGKR